MNLNNYKEILQFIVLIIIIMYIIYIIYYFINIENFAIKKNSILDTDKFDTITENSNNTYCRNLSTDAPHNKSNFDDLKIYPEKYSIGCLNGEHLQNLIFRYENQHISNTDKDGIISEQSTVYPYYSYQCCANNKTKPKPMLSTEWKCVNIDNRFLLYRRNNDGDIEYPYNNNDNTLSLQPDNMYEILKTEADCLNKIKSIDNTTNIIKCNSNDLVNNYNKPLSNLCVFGYNKLLEIPNNTYTKLT